MIKRNVSIDLLQELTYARGPCGQEDEVRVICKRELAKYSDKVWVDAAGNVIGCIQANPDEKKRNGGKSAIRVMAHMDELAMIVKRIDPDGTLRVANLGGLKPGNIGQGPLDILADSMVLPGILSLGPTHSSKETVHVEETRTKAMDWTHLHVFTNKSPKELRELGVDAGTRVVISRDRRKLVDMGDCIGGYFMDNRAAIVVLLRAAESIRAGKLLLPQDVYFVMTTEEEMGGVGAAYASRTLPGDMIIAIDVGPICEEYGIDFRNDPIIVYGDSRGLYTKSVADQLFSLACRIGQNPQKAVWERFGSDASISKAYGQSARAGLISMPTLNTHGFEVIRRESLNTCADLLVAFLKEPE